MLFLPQVIPLVAAGIAWSWLLSSTGVVNQVLSHIGLGGVTRAWLGDFATALPAVGVIGAWVLLGLCTLLLLAGISKIDPALYEAARLDGAGPLREFLSITLPSLRQEIGVCVTVTVIAALASFDIVYISTQGGPGNATMVPGLEIYYLAFSERQVGVASALAVVLMVLVLACVLPIQWLDEGRSAMIVARREAWTGEAAARRADGGHRCCRSSACSPRRCTRRAPTRSGSTGRATRTGATSPTPSDAANMGELLKSSLLIVLGVVPVVGPARHDGRLRPRPPARIAGGRVLFLVFVLGPDPAVRGHHHAAVLPDARHRAAEHALGDHPAADRAVHAVLRSSGCGRTSSTCPTSSPRRRGSTAPTPGSCSGASTCRWPMPAISSLAILLFLWTWNQFLLAIVLVDDPTKRTMAGALGAFQGQWGTDIPLLCAGSLLILTPTLVVFLIFQRQFVSALLQGSLKG